MGLTQNNVHKSTFIIRTLTKRSEALTNTLDHLNVHINYAEARQLFH